MGFFSDLTGKTSANAANALAGRNADQLRSSYGNANNYATTGYDKSMGFYSPYAESGNAANTAYSNALGLNGQAAREKQFNEGYVNDPAGTYRTNATQTAMTNLLRKYNAGGSGVNSGAAMYGVGRLNMERFDRDWGDYLNRLQGMQGQGLQVAGQQAGLTSGYYGGMADRAIGLGNALVSNDTNATMAANNARQQGVNNLLAGAGTIIGAGTRFATGGGFSGGRGTPWVNPDNGLVWGG